MDDVKTIPDLLAEEGMPEEPQPPAPPWHVDSDHCLHGWITYGIKPTWGICDCEDPAHPWPPRAPGDGPRDCPCFYCHGHKPRWERGKLASCEYKDHHCADCHDHKLCTRPGCEFDR